MEQTTEKTKYFLLVITEEEANQNDSQPQLEKEWLLTENEMLSLRRMAETHLAGLLYG